MRQLVRRSAVVVILVGVLAGCRIDVLLENDQPLPGVGSWLADDVEALPGDGFIGAGCLFDNSNPATGVVAFDADAGVERVLSRCSSIEEGSLGAATTEDGTVYFVRSREIVPLTEYVYELVRVRTGRQRGRRCRRPLGDHVRTRTSRSRSRTRS